MKNIIMLAACALLASCSTIDKTNFRPQVAPPKDTAGSGGTEAGSDTSVLKSGIRYDVKLSSFGSRYFLYNSVKNESEEPVTVEPDQIEVETNCPKEPELKGASIYEGMKPEAGDKFVSAASDAFKRPVKLQPGKTLSITYTFQMPVGRCGFVSSEFKGVTLNSKELPFKMRFEPDGSLF